MARKIRTEVKGVIKGSASAGEFAYDSTPTEFILRREQGGAWFAKIEREGATKLRDALGKFLRQIPKEKPKK